MTNNSSRWLFALMIPFGLAFGLAACGGGSGANEAAEAEAGQAEEAGEHAMAEPGGEGAGEHSAREGAGEHRGGGEAGEHSDEEGGGEHARAEGGEHSEGGEDGEHGGEGGHDEEGEESGVYIGAAETWDVVRRGARLVLSLDSGSSAFVGSVENMTEHTLCAIRVEVHLSTGTELGPTARVDLPAGQTTSVSLLTEGEAFESYTAHPEMSPCGDR